MFNKTVAQGAFALCAFLLCLFPNPALAKKKKSTLPRITHPVVLWARTLSESTDLEERKRAAFKLSQYSQLLYQEEAINTLIKCIKEDDITLKVLCTKAMGRAGNHSKTESIRKILIETYKEDKILKDTIVRTLIFRKDSSPLVYSTFLEAAKKSEDSEELLALMGYFELYTLPADIDAIIALYQRTSNIKLKRSAIKVLAERAQGQDSVVTLFTQCVDSKDTTLVLACLSGLQTQGRKDAKTWAAVNKALDMNDADVIDAALDVIQALPATPVPSMSKKMLDLLESLDDVEITEKAILALGVCGDYSEAVVLTLLKILEKKGGEEAQKIASALVLAKQAVNFKESTLSALGKCATEGGTPSLRSACLLSSKELEKKKPIAPPIPSPEASPTTSPTAD